MTKVSVIIPVLNERGTIRQIIYRVDPGYEIIIVDGHSTDGTLEEAKLAMFQYPIDNIKLKICTQPGKGKADAVIHGFNQATGDVLVILDGDMTIDPESIPAIVEKVRPGVLVNTTRFEIDHEKGAMRFLNVLGNKFFAVVLSWITGQPMTDSLAGTKCLMRSDWLLMKSLPKWNDPFIDHTLLFNAALMGMKIVEVPVAYKARVYGHTNISRFRHGWILLRMSCVALWRFKIKHLDRKFRGQ